MCLLDTDPSKYFFIAQGMLTIDNVDDAEEMKLTDEAFNILNFTQVYITLKYDLVKFLLNKIKKNRKTKMICLKQQQLLCTGVTANGSKDQEKNKLKLMVLKSVKKYHIYWVLNLLI